MTERDGDMSGRQLYDTIGATYTATPGRDVIAVEQSALMRAQRPADAAPCVAAVAEPWRVARRVVVFTHLRGSTRPASGFGCLWPESVSGRRRGGRSRSAGFP